ncbi:Glycosyltransferase involved in cell wall bisynthesis [Sanguibacter gelidistatuariae]|uniref:Glycosyltransferase involved in cell wall bisynthesis n=1 Tax=Sanguibacter gelidistatuariae TaxID=1814289 RepID=A0A1G6QQN5_9MICO|nr:glycosyltransferase [Sanguibacter gelidistatuariae]SDC94284.1 Glycosyltransferase involved in cell wall bisynthesis [Sanguibacter gelidistatuariae]
MKIIAVTAWFPSPKAPTVGTFVEKDVRVLARDHDVEVVHLIAPHLADRREADVDTIDHDGLVVHRIVMSPQRPDQILRARRLLEPLLAGADLVHTMAFPSLLPFARTRPTAPWVHTEHWSGLTTPATLPPAWRLALPVLRPLLRRPDVVTAVCEYLARPIRAERRDRSTVIVPCIVPAPAALTERSPGEGRPLELVGVGGLIDRKDPLLAVRCLAELGSRGHDVRLTWAGSGPLHDDALALAADLAVSDRLTLLGNVDTAGVSAALDAADLFFLPTKADNFCVSAAEALVHGRPVVVGATGGQGEYIDASVGELVDHQDAAAYADAIERVWRATDGLSAGDVAATLGDRFSPETVRRGYLDAYDLARAGRGA